MKVSYSVKLQGAKVMQNNGRYRSSPTTQAYSLAPSNCGEDPLFPWNFHTCLMMEL